MNARLAASAARERLAAAGIKDAAFEAEHLVRVAAHISRARFFTDPDLDEEHVAAAMALVARRVRREPAAYIAGQREFYGHDLLVTPDVLIPRPESELLVDLAVAAARDLEAPAIVDVGTGSGAIALAVALDPALPPDARVLGIDCSPAAIGVAAANRTRLGARLDLAVGDLATAVSGAAIVLANLPYIASAEIEGLEPEVSRWEPRVALDGGDDGLRLIRRVVDDCATRVRPRLLALEVGYGMAPAVRMLAAAAGATVEVVRDLAGIERVVCARWA